MLVLPQMSSNWVFSKNSENEMVGLVTVVIYGHYLQEGIQLDEAKCISLAT